MAGGLLELAARVLDSNVFWDEVDRNMLALTCRPMRALVAERSASITVDPAGGYVTSPHAAGLVDRIKVKDNRIVSDLEVDALAGAVAGVLNGALKFANGRSYTMLCTDEKMLLLIKGRVNPANRLHVVGGLAINGLRDLILALGHENDIGDVYVTATCEGVDLGVIRGLSSLRTFRFDGTRCVLQDIDPLADCPNLESVQLDDCWALEDLHPLSGLLHLRELHFELMGPADLPFYGMSMLTSNSLQRLSIENYGSRFVLLNVSSLAANCPNLTSLTLAGCSNVVGVDALRAALPGLQVNGDYNEDYEDEDDDEEEEEGWEGDEVWEEEEEEEDEDGEGDEDEME